MISPLEVYKGIDKEVHSFVMKRTKDWNKKKIVKTCYSLAGLSFLLGMNSMILEQANKIAPYGFFIGHRIGADWSAANIYSSDRDEITSNETTDDDFLKKYTKGLSKHTRLPVLALGSGLFASNIFSAFQNGNLDELGYLSLGGSLISTSLSSYLWDRDPKLLQRDNVLKKAYNWAADKLAPTPEPVPVRRYETLDNIVI